MPLAREHVPIELTKDLFHMQRDPSTPAPPTLTAGATYTVDLPIRWGDCDALKHLNNTVYFRLMEEARIKMMQASGLPYPEGQGIVLAHASCDFKRSFTYPADVRVSHVLTRIGRSSMELALVLTRADDPEQTVYASGRNVLVWTDMAQGTSLPWPAYILEGLAAHTTGVAEQHAPDAIS